MYTTQFEGGPQAVGFGVADAADAVVAGVPVSVAIVVGEASGAAVVGLLVSVAGVVGEASTEGVGVAVGRRTTT
jgi:hypothetical protein